MLVSTLDLLGDTSPIRAAVPSLAVDHGEAGMLLKDSKSFWLPLIPDSSAPDLPGDTSTIRVLEQGGNVVSVPDP
jgi:hypothetical protein